MKPEERTNKERRLSSKTEGLCDISITIQKAKFKPFKAPLGHALQTDCLVDVVVDPHLRKHLRPHRRSGFHLQSSRGIQTSQSFGGGDQTDGSFLVDEMGLGNKGKTVR